MLCEQCKERPATVHVVRQVNGVREEKWLCEECARQQGELTFEFGPGGIGFSFQNMLSGLFGSALGQITPGNVARPGTPVHAETVCPVCGTSLADFRRTGLLGCAECYEFFDPALQAVYRRVQGSTEHQGKRPAGRSMAGSRVDAASAGQASSGKPPTSVEQNAEAGSARRPAVSTPQERLLELRAQLQDAIRAENYEQAAHLRDEIHALEAKLSAAAKAKPAGTKSDTAKRKTGAGKAQPTAGPGNPPTGGPAKPGPDAGANG